MRNILFFIVLLIIINILSAYLYINNIEKFTASKNIIVSHIVGGLGNRIYMILAGISFAEKWGMNYYFLDSEIEDDPHYTDRNKMINELKSLFPKIKFLDKNIDTSKWITINENNINITNYKNIILSGYFQDEEKYFLNPKINLNEPYNNILKSIDFSKLFFMQLRFGDYIGTSYELDLIYYYKKCIYQIKKQISTPIFFILSDEISSAKSYMETNNLLNKDECLYDTSTERLDTLYYITKCRGGICANSSFSRIGAYFIINRNKNLIFYPNDTMRPMSLNAKWLTIVNI